MQLERSPQAEQHNPLQELWGGTTRLPRGPSPPAIGSSRCMKRPAWGWSSRSKGPQCPVVLAPAEAQAHSCPPQSSWKRQQSRHSNSVVCFLVRRKVESRDRKGPGADRAPPPTPPTWTSCCWQQARVPVTPHHHCLVTMAPPTNPTIPTPQLLPGRPGPWHCSAVPELTHAARWELGGRKARGSGFRPAPDRCLLPPGLEGQVRWCATARV